MKTESKALAPNGNFIHLTTGEPLPPVFDYHIEETHPDKEGLILNVWEIGGNSVGRLHCINVGSPAQPILKWFGKNHSGTASGDARATRSEAAKDVIAWATGKHPECVKHGLKK